MDYLDPPDDLPVELVQFLRRYPQFGVLPTADALHRETREVFRRQGKTRDVANHAVLGVFGVPVAGDLDGVSLVGDRVKIGCQESRAGTPGNQPRRSGRVHADRPGSRARMCRP